MGHGFRSLAHLVDSNVLRRNPCLTSLNLARNRLCDRGGLELSSLFAEPGSYLTDIDLSGNRMGAPAGWALTEAFGKSNHKIRSINLDDNDFGEETLLIVSHIQRTVAKVQYTEPNRSVIEIDSDGYGGCCSGKLNLNSKVSDHGNCDDTC